MSLNELCSLDVRDVLEELKQCLIGERGGLSSQIFVLLLCVGTLQDTKGG
jgi:hypothetical protein